MGGEGHDKVIIQGAEADWTTTDTEDGKWTIYKNAKTGAEYKVSVDVEEITFESVKAVEAISEEDKAKIDAWIQANDLNEYGDPKDTNYLGGTPLFDESNPEGGYPDRYHYIVATNPDKPWNIAN
jgi:hypothetical protein